MPSDARTDHRRIEAPDRFAHRRQIMSDVTRRDDAAAPTATVRKPYHAPEFHDLGAVRDLTLTSTTVNQGGDIEGDGGPPTYAS